MSQIPLDIFPVFAIMVAASSADRLLRMTGERKMNEHSVFKNTTEKVVFSIQRHPQRGPHPVWYVFLDSTLLCACAYRKGAQALIEFLIKEIQQ